MCTLSPLIIKVINNVFIIILIAKYLLRVLRLERLRQCVAPEPPITCGPGERGVSVVNLASNVISVIEWILNVLILVIITKSIKVLNKRKCLDN